MKLKALFLALAVAGAGASYALADDGHNDRHDDHDARPPTAPRRPRRRRRIAAGFHLRGTLVSVGGVVVLDQGR